MGAKFDPLLGAMRTTDNYVVPLNNSETLTYINALTVKPSLPRTIALDNLFTELKTLSIWTKTDWLSLSASTDRQQGKVNLKNPAQSATEIGTPTFVTDIGFSGDAGANPGINTGINLNTAVGLNYVRDSAHMGVWVFNEVAGGGLQALTGSNGRAEIWPNLSGTFYVRANCDNLISVAPVLGASLGHRAWSRTGATAVKVYSDGIVIATSAEASLPLVTSNGAPKTNTVLPNSAIHFGGGATDAEILSMRNALGNYFNASMIIPIFEIILVIGDSNNHFAASYDASIDVVNPNIWAVKNDGAGGLANFRGLWKGASPDFYYNTDVSWTCSFLRDYYIRYGNLIPGRVALILQVSGGGSGLFTQTNYWQNPSGVGYLAAVKAAKIALNSFPNSYIKFTGGVLGTNDATISTVAATWQIAFDAMITALRSDIPNSLSMPYIAIGMPPSYLATGTATAIQAVIAATPTRLRHCGYADPSNPTVLNNGGGTDIHYDAIDARGVQGAPTPSLGDRVMTGWLDKSN